MRGLNLRWLAGILLWLGALQLGFSQSAAAQLPSWPLPPADTTDGRLFSLDMRVALLCQVVRQHVLTDGGTLSRLEWGQFVPSTTIRVQVQPAEWWLMASVEAGIPMELGVVIDQDFLPGTSNVTNYSQHDLQLDNRFNLAVGAGYNFDLPVCLLRPQLGFSYRRHTMTGRDGYLQYPVSGFWTGDEEQEPVSGKVLQYQLDFFLPSISLFVHFHTKFPVTMEVGIIPYMWVIAVDSHYVRLKEFNDYMHGSPGCYAELAVQIHSINLSLGVEYLRAFSGKTVTGSIGTNSSYKKDSTTTPALDSLGIYLGVGVTFLSR